MKRVYKLIGLSALFLRRDAIASSEFSEPSTNVNLPFDAKGDLATIPNESSIEITHSSSTIPSTSSEGSPNTLKPKKRTKKETAQKKKPTNSKTARSPTSTSASSSKSSATLRRIKKEYEDAVSMGICYDWGKQKLVKPKKGSTVNQEYQKIICVGPLVSNLRHWHFSFRGCGIYENGIYHGRIILPKDYPSTPPRVQLWTPSGRFVPRHDICLSASSYHPESWTPRWTILSLVQALRLHMLTNPQEIGGKRSSLEETQEYAKESLTWWAKFNAGKNMIEINHASLLGQEVLSVKEKSDKKSSADKSKDDAVAEEADAKTETEKVPEAFDAELGKESRPQAVKSKSSKSPKPRKKRKSKKTGEASTAVLETLGKKEVESQNPVLSVLAKVIGSPFRMALFSLLLFFWVISSSPS